MRTKNNNVSVAGRSFIFNLLFVLTNLVGITCVTIGYHDQYPGNPLLMKLVGFLLLAVAIAGLLIFRGRLMMANVSRVIVGGLFIVSGLVKANDPLGFAYKLEEYFEDGALAYRIKTWFSAPTFTLEYFIQHALLLSVVICIVEIVIGVMLIIGGKIKTMSYALVLMMGFFTFLTWHTATCDGDKKFLDRDTYELSSAEGQAKLAAAEVDEDVKIINKTATHITVDEMKLPQCVKDCGCFGDAMKGSIGRSLEPKESLWKDIVVLYLSLWIFVAQWIIRPNTKKQNLIFGLTSVLLIVGLSAIFSWYFPVLFGIVAIILSLWIKRVGGKFLGNDWGAILTSTILSLIVTTIVLNSEPLKDYRPYAVGSNLKEKMNNGEAGVFQSLLRYVNKKTNEERFYDGSSKEFVASKIWEDSNWEYKDMVTKTIKPTKLASITEQFNPTIKPHEISEYELEIPYIGKFISENGMEIVRVKNLSSGDIYEVPVAEYTTEEYTDEYYQNLGKSVVLNPEIDEISIRNYIVEVDEIIVVTSKNLKSANWKHIAKLKDIAAKAKENGIPVVLLSSVSKKDADAFRKKYNFPIAIFANDEIELKAIARSNPSMMVIQKGIVTGKFSHGNTPTFDWLNKNLFKK